MTLFNKYLIALLFLAVVTVWTSILTFPSGNFRLVTCNVGQGDASLLIYGKTQILLDGGPDNSVIDCLGKYLPFWDRTIEAVVLSHPDSDHLNGLNSVMERYDIGVFIEGAVENSSNELRLLKSQVGGRGIRTITAAEGTRLGIGMIHLDVVSPARTAIVAGKMLNTGEEDKLRNNDNNRSTNDQSLAVLLRVGNFRGLFPGDLSEKQLSVLIDKGLLGDINYLKVPHHGSKTGLTSEILQIIRPEIAVISVGKKNSYGHPAPEIINLLLERRVVVRRTDRDGDIIVETDTKTNYFKVKGNN